MRVCRAAVVFSAIAWAASASAQSPGKGESAQVTVKVNGAALQGFSVVLVLGDLQGDGKEDNVPAAARRALKDMKDFLPYKSYRLLDTAWILGSSGTRASTRLRGSEKQEYELNLAGEVTPQGAPATTTLKMTFQLSDGDAPRQAWAGPGPDTDATQAQLADLESRRKELVERLRAARERPGTQDGQRQGQGQGQGQGQSQGQGQAQLAQEMEKQLAMYNLQLSMSRNRLNTAHAVVMRKLIDTSFNMDIGETVVVGTSRLGSGDKALIALLTAVPRGKP